MKGDHRYRTPRHLRVEEGFALIEAAAIAGKRCPQDEPHGPLAKNIISDLVEAKRVRSEVYSRNWRVVQVLVGPHAGKRTMECPHGGEPYIINGIRTEKSWARSERREPWRPS